MVRCDVSQVTNDCQVYRSRDLNIKITDCRFLLHSSQHFVRRQKRGSTYIRKGKRVEGVRGECANRFRGSW